MKETILTDDQLRGVIDLREKGMSWMGIQRATGVSRRVAKRNYDQWQKKQSRKGYDEALKEVAAQEYRRHLDLLSRLANSLIDSLDVPEPFTDVRSAHEVLSQVMATDIYQEELPTRAFSSEPAREKRIRHMNELLLGSLREHTRRDVPWKMLDKWELNRDNCVKSIGETRTEVGELLQNILEQKLELKGKLERPGRSQKLLQDFTDSIVTHLWSGDVLAEEVGLTVMKGEGLIHRGSAWVVFSDRAPERRQFVFDGDTDNVATANEVKCVAEWVLDNFRKGKPELIERMRTEVPAVQEATDRLGAALNPLALRRIVLNTRCSICPI